MGTQKIDLFRLHKEEYVTPKDPVLVETTPGLYLVIDGMGEPGGEAFATRLVALYAVAYTIKRMKKEVGQDYVVSKLEALWWGVKGPGDFSSEPRSDWNWKLMIRTPDSITEEDLWVAIAACQRKKQAPEVAKVRLETLQENVCAQVLHVGPYSEIGEAVKRINAFVEKMGLSFRGLHHEIYLSDPRRVSPEKLKTIVRMPVVK